MILPHLKPIERLILDDSMSEGEWRGSPLFMEVRLHSVGARYIHGVKPLMVAVKNIARRFGDVYFGIETEPRLPFALC
jgi:hypothetical protein